MRPSNECLQLGGDAFQVQLELENVGWKPELPEEKALEPSANSTTYNLTALIEILSALVRDECSEQCRTPF